MKNKKIIAKFGNHPVNLVVPNTTVEKMEAISNLSKAIFELSKAINGVNVQATISHNVISNVDTAISVK